MLTSRDQSLAPAEANLPFVVAFVPHIAADPGDDVVGTDFDQIGLGNPLDVIRFDEAVTRFGRSDRQPTVRVAAPHLDRITRLQLVRCIERLARPAADHGAVRTDPGHVRIGILRQSAAYAAQTKQRGHGSYS